MNSLLTVKLKYPKGGKSTRSVSLCPFPGRIIRGRHGTPLASFTASNATMAMNKSARGKVDIDHTSLANTSIAKVFHNDFELDVNFKDQKIEGYVQVRSLPS
jgi:hypothetical protein